MTVHPFGAVSSPSCSIFALRNTTNENEEEIGNAVANSLRRNFYVDDYLRSVGTEAEGKDQIDGHRKACAKGGFRLTKFISNRRSVLESIPEEERSKDVKTLDLNYDNLPVERALGVQWCVESDTFGFRIVVKEKPLTRRAVLSTVSSIYDPLGFAAPFTLIAKKLLQDLCREEKLGWDDELSDPYLKRWELVVKWTPTSRTHDRPSLCETIRLRTGEDKTASHFLRRKLSRTRFSGVSASLWQRRSHTLPLSDWESTARPDQNGDDPTVVIDCRYRLRPPRRNDEERARR